MIHDTSLHDTYIWETDVDCFNISGDTLRLIFGEGKSFESIVIRLFLEDILEEKRIATNDTARISSLNEEEKHEEDMKHMEDDTSVLGSWAHFLERLTNDELNTLSQLLEIKKYEEGDIVFNEKDTSKASNLIMVLSGAIKWNSTGLIVKDYELIFKDDSTKELFERNVEAENYTITAEITSIDIK